MKKWWFLFFCVLGTTFCGYLFFPRDKEENPPPKSRHLKETFGPYFFTVPVSHFSSSKIPCLLAKIENKDFVLELDLGFEGETVFQKKVIDSLVDKSFIKENTMYGVRGKSYPKKKFRAPKMEIGKLTFSNSYMLEESDEFELDSYVLRDENQSSPCEHGRLGWELFKNCNLFLDLGNSRIAFCDSAQTLKNHGVAIENYAKTDLHTERGLVEIVISGEGGDQFWTLDTGSTWNIFNADEERSLEELMSDPNNVILLPLKIGSNDFSQISFHKASLPLPIRLDAILGMEFFESHQVFIDFSEMAVYISRSKAFE